MSNKEKQSDESTMDMVDDSESDLMNVRTMSGARVAPLGADAKSVPPKKK